MLDEILKLQTSINSSDNLPFKVGYLLVNEKELKNIFKLEIYQIWDNSYKNKVFLLKEDISTNAVPYVCGGKKVEFKKNEKVYIIEIDTVGDLFQLTLTKTF